MENASFESPTSYRIQKTLKSSLSFSGVGLHGGQNATITLHPAPENTGIVFRKKIQKKWVRIFAHYDAVVATQMATTLGHPDIDGATVGTVEHLLAALFSVGISNLEIEVQGQEIPILDGSAAPMVDFILSGGIQFQPYTTPIMKILKPVRVQEYGGVCELLPRGRLRVTTSVDFHHPSIGLQTYAIDLTPRGFREHIAAARTFGFLSDVDRLKAKQLALGASVENVLAFSDEGVISPGGIRYVDECARHKILDAVGDLALCGCWIEGELVSFKGGHSLHLALLQRLKNFRDHWTVIPSEPLSSLHALHPSW